MSDRLTTVAGWVYVALFVGVVLLAIGAVIGALVSL